jgi:serine/threonine protein kinase/tetratricopeptide (TPR) repeat protein
MSDWPPNPFPKGEPDPRDEMFFDREEHLHALRSALTTQERVVLVEGPRRMGKSSLLRRFEMTSRDNAALLYIDLRLIDYQTARYSPGGITSELLRIIAAALGTPYGIVPTANDLTPDNFRQGFLPKVSTAAQPRRLCLLFDETELLYEENASTIADILRACHIPDTGAIPLVVFSWGRPLGAFSNASAAEWLKAAMTITVSPFSEALTKDIPGRASQYRFTDSARQILWDLTRGHPLWVTSLNYRIYLARSLAQCHDEVTDLEVLHEVKPTCNLIDKGVWYAWEQLTPLQSLIGRAIADLGYTEANPAHAVPVDVHAIQAHLSTFADVASSVKVLDALLGLEHNAVVERRSDGFILCAPILGVWLREQSIEGLKRAAGSDADYFVFEARESYILGRYDAARHKLQDALTIDPTHLRACLLLSAVYEKDQDLDKAVDLLTSVLDNNQHSVAPTLIDLLKKRITKATSTNTSPAQWMAQLTKLSKTGQDIRDVAAEVTRYYLDMWEAAVRTGMIRQAALLLDEFSTTGLPDWRTSIAYRYAEVLKSFRDSDAMLKACLDAVLQTFPKLIEGSIEHRATEDDRTFQDLQLRFAHDPTAVQVLLQYFGERRRVPAWWQSTLEVLQAALASNIDVGDHSVPVQFFQDLATRVPEELRRPFLSNIGIHLTTRLSRLFHNDIEEGTAAIRLLCSLPDYDVSNIVKHLEDYLLDVVTGDGSDASVVRFFLYGSTAYSILLEFVVPASDLALSILDQVEILLVRMKTPEEPVPADDREWALFVRAWSALQVWRDLLESRAFRGSDKADSLKQLLIPPARVAERGRLLALMPVDTWAKDVTDVLAGRYHDLTPLDVSVPGIPRDLLKFYRASWDGEIVILKAYRLPKDRELQRFLQVIWESERRVLLEVSTRGTARSLTRLRFAERLSERDDTLVIGIEAVGPRTLRDVLDRGRSGLLADSARGALWQQIYSLVEGIDYLHRMHFLHRSIRPENIFVVGEGPTARLKLGNFEWSLYLHNMAEVLPERRWLDRYSSPETIALRFDVRDRDQGESFTSDVYGLGLILFELLVRRLTPLELGRYQAPDEYSSADHDAWLAGLRAELDEALSAPYELDQRLLIREMLETSPRRRKADLSDTVEIVRQIAIDLADIQAELSGSRPLFCTTLYRQTRESIEGFLTKYIDVSLLGTDSNSLKRVLEEDLSGARIFRNLGDPDRPLYLEGKQVPFTLAPFQHETRARRRYFEEVPFLRVATQADRKGTFELGHLPGSVEVMDLRETREQLDGLNRDELLARGRIWRDLFDLAQRTEDLLPAELRRYHTLLRITADVEESLWSKQIEPFVLVTGPSLGKVVIKGTNDDGRALVRVMRSQLSRDERYFELTTSADSLAPYDISREWQYLKDGPDMTIELRSGTSRVPPLSGYVRPSALSGNRAVRQRRSQVLGDLENDAHLLRALTNPSALRGPQGRMVPSFINRDLDEDKKRIITEILERPPLFVVQGPPGTGKTTLAAELLLQTLQYNRSARILITAQAHDPLNNLLTRVEEALNKTRDEERPIAVRLAPIYRVKDATTAEEADIFERYHPSLVAKRRLAEAAKWNPPANSRIDSPLVERWRHRISADPTRLSVAIERRIISSANLVYTTANDRSLMAMSEEKGFDLLVFEEAAKAYPLELLGPMRLARNWVLIGDPAQLAAFEMEEFRQELRTRVRAVIDEGTASEEERGTSLKREWERNRDSVSDLFSDLLNRGMEEGYADQLKTQWRMHPDIGEMLRRVYYPFLENGDATRLARLRQHPLIEPDFLRRRSLVWIDVPRVSGNDWASDLAAEQSFGGAGYCNAYEAVVLYKLMKLLRSSGRSLHDKVAFLSPYRQQLNLIDRVFESWDERNQTTGSLRGKAFTVDSYQGRQTEVVVVSLVRNNRAEGVREAFGFMTSKQRTGVMFSRAEALLIVVGCSEHFGDKAVSHISEAYQYIDKVGAVVPATSLLDGDDTRRIRDLRRGNVFATTEGAGHGA